MNIYRTMPHQLIEGWSAQWVQHAGDDQFGFHYHDVEEWLEVQSGDIRFFSAGGVEYHASAGEALHIPLGEVHRVQIGSGGVTYQMWTPIAVNEDAFAHKLDDEELALVQKNLGVPDAEDAGNMEFFKDFLSDTLIFRTAKGLLLNKGAFLKRPPASITRVQSDGVRFLHKSGDSILLSTVIHTMLKDGGERQSNSNNRLFVREDKIWKCRVWLNYPEPGSS